MTAQIMARPRPGTAGGDDANHQLGAHLLDVVRRQDAAIPAARRAPRTVAEMRARLIGASGQQSCGSCGGTGGQTVDTSSGGITRQTWVSCGSCHGTGVA
ncbi:hypothetical protein AB0M86_29375 [Streptomyces sp. NPDC051639]|uniref:hypothetical protein n=1 Tax=Streptomyces sp. NPDC051639 TaxID=3155671 RepID=UPI00341CBF15